MKQPKFLKVPNNNIDYKALFAQVDEMKFKRSDKIANVKNSIIILLNMIQYPEHRRIKELKNNYYTILANCEMVEIFSVEGWYLVKGLLVNNNIIESDGQYENGVVPMGYKLVITKLGPDSKYLKLEEIGSVYKNYVKFLASLGMQTETNNVNHLLDEFNGLTLTLDPSVFDFVRLYRDKLIDRFINNEEDELCYYLIHHRVGEYLSMINDFNNKKYNPFISLSNNRFYSLINTCKKELRYYIRNGLNRFNEYDLKASYNYVLATMLNDRYFNYMYTNTNGYNISSIFNKLSNKLFNIYKSNNNITYMSSTYFENEDIARYRELPFEDGIYEYVLNVIALDPDFEKYSIQTREFIKDQFKLYFNHDDSQIRKGEYIKRGLVINDHQKSKIDDNSLSKPAGLFIVQFMNKYFPSVNRIVNELIYKKNIRSPLSILLQRSEAYLVQQVVAKKIKELYPDQLIFCVHDSLLIEEGLCQPEKIVKLFKDTLEEFTGVRPGVSNKSIDPISIIDSIVEEDYNEILSKKDKPTNELLDKKIISKIYRSLKFISKDNGSFKTKCHRFKEFIKIRSI